jgi:colanic acid/amylovoran biosynthesis glycosyltransferase
VAKRAPANPMRLGYLTSQYPATSHTFISREVAAVRALGAKLDTFSIRAPTGSELNDPALSEEARTTFTVLKQPAARIASAHLRTLLTQPGGYLRTLGLATRHRAPGLKGFALSLAYFAEAVVLARELRRRCITHLHNHFANSGATVGFLSTRLLGMPWSFTMHGISETDYPAGLMLGRKIEAADFVACVSYFGRAQAMRLVEPDQWRKLHVVRCGLPLPALPAHAQPGSVKRIISVGRLSAEKGQAGLLEAFAAVAGDHGGVELVLIGDGPERELLQSRAAALGIGDMVTFAGRCGEMETIEQIARSDILVLSSFMEGLPIVLMEAMAVGTPVIASRVAGIPELVEDGKSGLLFTPSDWDALADCIRRLLENDALRAKLARAGSAAVKRQFDVERSARAMLALFQSESALVDG